jgi:1-acyl-sn-glycerol-3-phosphate acyltransferase
MEHSKRHRFIWALALPIFRVFLWLKFNFHPKFKDLPSPCLIVPNHCTDWDPFFVGVAVKKYIYYVASDHIFRKKITGALIRWAQAPIVRLKGSTAGDTALTALRRLRAGFNVGVFAEGNRTYNGCSCAIFESTAKLAKSAARIAGASLATFRIKGGYLSSPRWAGAQIRRGRTSGEIVRVYSPDELKAMSNEQVADAIRADIYEDAYATQRQWKIPYKGHRRAEFLERALYLCPKCGALGKLKSSENDLRCTACGMETTYNAYGFFEGGNLPFDNVYDWDNWQAGEIQKRADEAGDKCIASDSDIDLKEDLEDFQVRHAGTGEMKIFRDRLECCGLRFPFTDITGVGLPGPQGLDFSLRDGRHFSVTSRKVRNIRKYLTIYHAVTAPGDILAI